MKKRHAIPIADDDKVDVNFWFNLAFFTLGTMFACSILGLAFALFFVA